MSPIPSDLAAWLPDDVRSGDVAACARVGRTFDRVSGEALVLRMRRGAPLLLTRPTRDVAFRALPLADADPLALVEGREVRLHARMVDGRLLTMPLSPFEVDAIRGALSIPITSTSSAPPRRLSDRPPSLRPPESADAEVVRVPRNVRPPSDPGRPAVTAPPSRPPPPSRPTPTLPPRPTPADAAAPSQSLRPPGLDDEPAPVVRSARDTGALRARFQHHWEHGELDDAVLVARALVHLGVADPMERRLAAQHPASPPALATPLTFPLFQAHLAHSDEHPELGRLLAAITPAYLALRVRPERELGLRPHDEVDLATTEHPFAQLFARSARALGVDVPRLFLRADVPGGMAHLATLPPASLCGATVAHALDVPSTLHVVGHHLALCRPEVHLFALAQLPDVHALVLAVLWLEDKLSRDDARNVDARIGALAESLSRAMAAPVRREVRAACASLVIPGDARSAVASALRAMRRGAYLSAARAGYVLSGSLAASERTSRIMPPVAGVATDEVVDELITYSVSPAWSALRGALGIGLDPSNGGT